jgi:sporulation protein YlmC with PRC-barrel domain
MKKQIIAIAAIAVLSSASVFADSYSVFRVCEDKHVIRTSDGEEAGHVEYIVVDPGQQRIVSTVVTGGVIGSKHIALPFSAVQVRGEREIVLTEITRERIVSAPTIEVSRFSSTSVIEPSFIERSTSHFTSGSSTSVDVNRTTTTNTTREKQTSPPATREETTFRSRASEDTAQPPASRTSERERLRNERRETNTEARIPNTERTSRTEAGTRNRETQTSPPSATTSTEPPERQNRGSERSAEKPSQDKAEGARGNTRRERATPRSETEPPADKSREKAGPTEEKDKSARASEQPPKEKTERSENDKPDEVQAKAKSSSGEASATQKTSPRGGKKRSGEEASVERR